MKTSLTLLFAFLSFSIFAQNVGIGTANPKDFAKLDIESSTSGLLMPRVDNAQRTTLGGNISSLGAALSSQYNGLMVYDTQNNTLYMWDSNKTDFTNGGWSNVLDADASINDADADPNNELQNLSNTVSGANRTINISGGTGTTFSVNDADADPANEIQTLSVSGSNLTISGGNTVAIPAGITGSGSANYLTKFTAATVVANSLIRDDGNNIGINIAPSTLYKQYVYKTELDVDGDGQATIYAFRTRSGASNGSSYGNTGVNCAIKGYSYWGDNYNFGVGGYCYNDYVRSGGIIGANQNASYWGSLGYKNSGSATYGVYGSAAYASGAGFLPNNTLTGIGIGGYGGILGAWTRGDVMGHISSGEIFASYNLGDEYTSGHQIEIIETPTERIAAYSVTSSDIKVYENGSETLSLGSKMVIFDDAFKSLLGENPTITVSPMGECNGLYITNISSTGFEVRELGNGSSDVAFTWIAVAKRIDSNTKAEIPEALLHKDFDKNMEGVMFNENNLEQSATPVWWDGNTIRFDAIPQEEIQKPAEEQIR